jgi:ATP-dependent exoDNAse (exonuclease V) beta subunit
MGPPESAYSVVWWSPEQGVLALDMPPAPGLRREDLIVRDVPAAALQAHLDAFRAWRRERDDAVAAASRPSVRVVTATEAAGGQGSETVDRIEVAVESLAPAAGRPGGARFGALVHALLGRMPLGDAGVHALAPLAEAQARILGADAVEKAAAVDLAQRVREHPVLRAAAQAEARGTCFRETPVTLRLEEGDLVEGVVDLAFDDGQGFVVVDFKTDRELDGALERYRRQVQIYAAAIAISTGRPARGMLMRV